jgi:hypothetical protein
MMALASASMSLPRCPMQTVQRCTAQPGLATEGVHGVQCNEGLGPSRSLRGPLTRWESCWRCVVLADKD